MGYKEFDLNPTEGDFELVPSDSPALGLFTQPHRIRSHKLSDFIESARLEARKPELLILTKGSSASTIHRPAHTDYIGIKSSIRKVM